MRRPRASASTAGTCRSWPSTHCEGLRTHVIVDLIAGTSAGGINGICLAKALAYNLSQDELRNLWFERGDIDGLLAHPPFSAPQAEGGSPRERSTRRLSAAMRWAQWIYAAFRRMDTTRAPAEAPSLLPERHKLELFVTVTDRLRAPGSLRRSQSDS